MEYTDRLISFLKRNFILHRHEWISIEDLTSLNELLDAGLSIRNSLSLIRISSNEKLFDELLKRLDKGNLMEEIAGDYLPARIASYLRPLLRNMSFAKALSLSLSFYHKSRDNSSRIEKSILYPFVLLFVSLSALYLFDTYGLDPILNMLRSFGSDLSSFRVIRIILRIIVYVFYFGMLTVTGALLYFSREKNITLFYLLCSRYLKNSLLQVYFCEEFISLFLIKHTQVSAQ